jgi:uncharacterized lipoprotein YddW (UPF0748 family)
MKPGRRSLIAGAVMAGAMPARARSPFHTEIVVRTIENLRTPADVEPLVALAAQHGVDTINLAVKQDEDDGIASGLVFHASAIAPRAPGYGSFDALAATIRAAHARGLRVRAWVPQFHDQMAIRAHPAWQMQAVVNGLTVAYTGRGRQEFFVNPVNPAARDYQRLIVEEIVRNYEVDGIVLDWVRFDDFNMDLSGETRTKFRAAAGFDPIGIDFSSDSLQRRQWNAWRTAVIADHVRRIRAGIDSVRAGVGLGVYILPPEFPEVAQDAALFSRWVDFLSPMAYYRDWGFGPRWVDRWLVPQTVARAGSAAVIPVLDEDLTDADAHLVLPAIGRMHPAITTLSWFAYGRWTPAALQRVERLSGLASGN